MQQIELNLWDIIWNSDLVVKFVLLSLILISIFSWAIILKKRKFFKEVALSNQAFLNLFRNCHSFKQIKSKIEGPSKGPNKGEVKMMQSAPFLCMFSHGYEEFLEIKENSAESNMSRVKEHFQVFGLDSIKRGLNQGVNKSNISMDSSLPTLASIGSVSPFIGLFGTVWGIINSFKGLAGGGGTIDAVAPGIAEALVATAVGLVAAIPAVWFFNYFSNKSSKLNIEMESFGESFLNRVERTFLKK